MLPIRGYSKAVSKQLEEKTIAQFPDGVLMAEVARQVANATHELLGDYDLPFLEERRICGLVGGGNNGGDCLLALAFMQARGYHTVAVLTTKQVHAEALAVAEKLGVYVVDVSKESQEQAIQAVKTIACRCEVWVDGIFGTGLKGEIREPLRTLISELKRYLDSDWPQYEVHRQLEKTASGIPLTWAGNPVRTHILHRRPRVVAVDIPSGIYQQDGTLPDVYLPADVTVTAGVIKSGALLPPGDRAWGKLRLVELKFPEPLPHLPAQLKNLDTEKIGVLGEKNPGEGKYPSRKDRGHSDRGHSDCDLNVLRLDELTAGALCLLPGADAHKYSRGVVQVVAGSRRYPLTALLVGRAALKAGCGLLRINERDYDPIPVLTRLPEALAGSGPASVLVAGPGIDPQDAGRKEALLAEVKSAFDQGIPLVLDAGALGFYAELLQLSPSATQGKLGGSALLTPHYGEAARLLSALGAGTEAGGVSVKEVAAAPVQWARTLAQVTGASVLLKGRNTVVSDPEGNIYSVLADNVGAATAGNGDALAGIIAGLLASWSALAKAHGKELDAGSIALIGAGAAWVHARMSSLRKDAETLADYLMSEEYNFLTGYLEYKHRQKPSPYASVLYEAEEEIPGHSQEDLEKIWREQHRSRIWADTHAGTNRDSNAHAGTNPAGNARAGMSRDETGNAHAGTSLDSNARAGMNRDGADIHGYGADPHAYGTGSHRPEPWRINLASDAFAEVDSLINARGYEKKWENGYEILQELSRDISHGFENKEMFEMNLELLKPGIKYEGSYRPYRVSESLNNLPRVFEKAWSALNRLAGTPRESAYLVLQAFAYLPPTLADLVRRS